MNRDAIRNNPQEMRRVLAHELAHIVYGLSDETQVNVKVREMLRERKE